MKTMQLNASQLASGLTLRPVQWPDLQAVAQLIYDVCEKDGDTTVAVTPEDLKLEWQKEDFNLATDTALVEDGNGRVVGYEEFFDMHEHYSLRLDGYVHPDFNGLGIGTTLLRAMEARAQDAIPLAAPDMRVFLRSTIDNRDEAGHSLHRNEGYSPKRYHWRMEIELGDTTPEPARPAGIELRPFDRETHARAVWEAANEAFRDHWSHHDVDFAEWCRERFEREDFDPALWLVAWDEDQVAGFSLNRFRMGVGWVGSLGVRRPWRKQGLGLALLQHSFGEFHRRGMRTIGLGVDALNPTGATRLYQRAGMHVASEFLTYEKELRPGRSMED